MSPQLLGRSVYRQGRKEGLEDGKSEEGGRDQSRLTEVSRPVGLSVGGEEDVNACAPKR